MTGTLICGLLCSYFGRKKTMILANLLSLSGFLFLRFSVNVAMLYISRIIAGFSFGLCFANIPPYTGEISQPRIRKFTGSFMPTFYNIGFVITFGLSTFLKWRTILSIVLCSPCVNIILLFFCPESPTWFMNQGKKESAIAYMKALRGDSEIALKEIKRIENNLEKQREKAITTHSSSFVRKKWEILSKGTFIRPFIVITTLIAICWHWTGGPMIGFYIIDMLQGFKIPMNPYWCAVLIACFQLVFGLIATMISSLIPRRKLFICCGVLESIGTFALGTTVYLNRQRYFIELLEEYPAISWIPLLALLCFYAGYFGGYVPVCFIILAELLPSNARSIGSSMATTCSISSLFVLIKFAPALQDALGLDGSFWLFSGVTFCSVIFCYFCVPETFGKTLESIEDHYRNVCYGNKITPKIETEICQKRKIGVCEVTKL